MATPPPTCPSCGALVGPTAHGGPPLHAEWHYATRTLNGWSVDDLVARMVEQRRLAELAGPRDDAPTAKLPPIGDTVRRRPPVPGVAELKGAELLRALADALDEDDDVNGDEL